MRESPEDLNQADDGKENLPDQSLLLKRIEKAQGSSPEGGATPRKRRRPPEESLLARRLKAQAKGPRKSREKAAAPTSPGSDTSRETEKESTDHKILLRLFKWTRLLIKIVVVSYLLGLILLVWGMRHVGQMNITSASIMYVPPLVWIAPAFFLLPFSWIGGWRTTLLLAAAFPLYLFGHLGYQFNAVTSPQDSGSLHRLRVMSWNRGQSKGVSLQPLKNEWRPDFILLQDAGGTERYYKDNENYSEFGHTASVGEFVLLSRWPIVSAEPLAPSRTRNRSGTPAYRAARFVVAALGQRCVIYNVHLESPRDTLSTYQRGAFLWGVIGLPGTPWAKKKAYYQQFWDEQLDIARQIADRIPSEFGPVIVAGDFNAPDFGPLYRLFASQLQDVHRVAGDGFGYTFPGKTNNPLGLFQAWLRLDQIFTSEHCVPTRSFPIPIQGQHLPVCAEFHWRTEPPSGLSAP